MGSQNCQMPGFQGFQVAVATLSQAQREFTGTIHRN